MTTKTTITDSQIRALRSEAGAAGDMDQVSLCDEALDGDEGAREKCADALKSVDDADTASLINYQTGEYLRRATSAECLASHTAARIDGGSGVILVTVDGRQVSCYVEE